MGEAKRRGTFEQRKSAAEIVRAAELACRDEARKTANHPQQSRAAKTFVAALFGLSSMLMMDHHD